MSVPQVQRTALGGVAASDEGKGHNSSREDARRPKPQKKLISVPPPPPKEELGAPLVQICPSQKMVEILSKSRPIYGFPVVRTYLKQYGRQEALPR